MDPSVIDIPRWYTAVAEWMACLLYLILLRKKIPVRKFIFGAAGALVVQVGFLVLTRDVQINLWIPCMIVAVGLMFLFIYTVSSMPAVSAGYCTVKAFIFAEFIASLEWQIHCFILDKNPGFPLWTQVVLMLFVYVLLTILIGFAERNLVTRENLFALSYKELIPAFLIAIFIFLFSNMNLVVDDSPFGGQVAIDIANMRTLVDFSGVVILYAYFSRTCEIQAERELSSLNSMLSTQYAQYRNYQNSLDIISMKYHDLKHQIAGLRAETDEAKRKEWLDAMEQELEVYEGFARTGNRVLDTILAGKISQARKYQVKVTCVIDGHLLDFMHVNDICTIFGNALDNALENAVLIPEQEKRLIHVAVSSQKNFVLIQVRNYCEEAVKLDEDGMPCTTKTDKQNHGFGMKSMRYTAEKYQGTMSVKLNQNWFELSILIPNNE